MTAERKDTTSTRWEVGDDGHIRQNGKIIAVVLSPKDALKMVAAPDLLEIASTLFRSGYWDGWDAEWLEWCADTIAKAKGE